jgi:GAF domain-containing protein
VPGTKFQETKEKMVPGTKFRGAYGAQVLNNLNENCEPKVRFNFVNFVDFFDFVVKKFCRSSLDVKGGIMLELQKDADRESNYRLMVEVVKTVFEGETDLIAVLANVSAVINDYLDDINWVGFYLLRGTELILGPFQGRPACSRIAWGKGVCGRAVVDRKPVVVPNVREFPGHIFCDAGSNAEIVIPLFRHDAVFGVLDVDSPRLNRFSSREETYLSQICRLLGDFLERPYSDSRGLSSE